MIRKLAGLFLAKLLTSTLLLAAVGRLLGTSSSEADRVKQEVEAFMHLLKYRVLVVLFATISTLGLNISAATAQSQSTIAPPEKTEAPELVDQSWHVDVAPYLWFPGINGTVGALGHDACPSTRPD
jgi:hypothetical protein